MIPQRKECSEPDKFNKNTSQSIEKDKKTQEEIMESQYWMNREVRWR